MIYDWVSGVSVASSGVALV